MDTQPPKYPTSCKKYRDWDKVEKEIVKQEAAEATEGDAAINTLFQNIYGNGSDEIRRAMNKSFVSKIFIVDKLNTNKRNFSYLIKQFTCFFVKCKFLIRQKFLQKYLYYSSKYKVSRSYLYKSLNFSPKDN